jgi:hypothetical protein
MQNIWIARVLMIGMLFTVNVVFASQEEEKLSRFPSVGLRTDQALGQLLDKVPHLKTSTYPDGIPLVSDEDLTNLEKTLPCMLPEVVKDFFKECAHLRWEIVELAHPKGRYPAIWRAFYRGQKSALCEKPQQSFGHLTPLMEVPDTLAHYCYDRHTKGVYCVYRAGVTGQPESWPSLTDFVKDQLRLFVQ